LYGWNEEKGSINSMTDQSLKKSYDVVIAGAGPAGSTLGYLLSKNGLEVLIVDKEAFPRPKLCAGLLTWKTLQAVEETFGVSFDRQFTVENVSEQYAIHEKFRGMTVQKSPEPFYLVDRQHYDMEVVSLAKDKGCEFLFGQQIIDLDIKRNTIFTKSGNSLSAKIIIGADGVNSVIRKKIYPQEIFRRNLSAAFQINVPVSKIKASYQGIIPRLFLGEVKWGYGWIFPRRNYSVVGMWGLIRKNKRLIDTYLDFLKTVTDVKIEKKSIIKSHPGPAGNFIKNPGRERILLVGDAAGFADPLTGEGIYYAHRSAGMAACAIIDFFNSSKDVNLGRTYKHYLSPAFKELRISRLIRDLAYTRLRYLAYLVDSSRVYFELVKIIQGISSYSHVLKPSFWIRALFR